MLHIVCPFHKLNAPPVQPVRARPPAGMLAELLMPAAYQDLLDHGWRRSGTYLYRPHLQSACCPHYTLRSHACEMQLTASQKRALRKFDLFLRGKWAQQQQQRNQQSAAVADHGAAAVGPLPSTGVHTATASAGAQGCSTCAATEAVRAHALSACSQALRSALQAADLAHWGVPANACAAEFVVAERGVHSGGRSAASPCAHARSNNGAEAAPDNAIDPHQVLQVTSAVCWQMAAKHAAAHAPAQFVGAAAQSKSAAKKTRKRQKRNDSEAQAGTAANKALSVAQVAADMAAQQVLPSL